MNYRIEKKAKFRIVGVAEPMYKDMEKNFEVIPKMWQKITLDGTLSKLVTMIGGEPAGILGVSVCNEEDNWRYFIAVTSNEAIDSKLHEHIIPACTWAIFPGEGAMPHALQELAKRIMSEWLPTSGYEYANAPEIEVYLNDDTKNSKFEIWLPVKKK